MVQLAATPYEIIIAQDWKSYTVYFSGEIDYAAAIEVSDKIDELVDACEDNLVFDLENVTFIDSEGMKILIKSAKKCVRNRAISSFQDAAREQDAACVLPE